MLCIGCAAANAQTSFTQRLQQNKVGEGKVTITQDKTIDDLVNGPKVTTTTPQTIPQSQPQSLQKTQQQAQPQHKEPKDSAPHKPDSSNQQRPEITTPEQPDTTATTPPRRRKKEGDEGV